MSTSVMPPTGVGDSALSDLTDLAIWVRESAEMKQENSLLRCVDKDLYIRTLPLLRKLGYDRIKGYGYQICRISGKTQITKPPHLKTLFFPLSVGSGSDSTASEELQVEGEVLRPGTFTQFNNTLVLDAQLDCLIVYVPETK